MTLNQTDFEYLAKFVLEHSAISLGSDKMYLIESRLAPLCRQYGVANVSEIVASIRQNPRSKLSSSIVDAVTTNETYFFRDAKPFDELAKETLPRIIAKKGARSTLNVWSAACSSGQEIYSVAMMLEDSFPELKNWDVKLYASDISNAMVERTKAGVFNQLEVGRGLPAALLIKHFNRKGESFHVKDYLKGRLQVFPLNLASTWPSLPSFDIVFLRNVLIYFDPVVKQEILQKTERVLAKDGVLFLGGSESTLGLKTKLVREIGKFCAWYRLPSS